MDLSWKYQMNPIEGTLKLESLQKRRKGAWHLSWPYQYHDPHLSTSLPHLFRLHCLLQVQSSFGGRSSNDSIHVRGEDLAFFNEYPKSGAKSKPPIEVLKSLGRKIQHHAIDLFNETKVAPCLKVGILRKKHFHFFFSCTELGNAAAAVALLSWFSHLNI